jgi:hypothetical protein
MNFKLEDFVDIVAKANVSRETPSYILKYI